MGGVAPSILAERLNVSAGLCRVGENHECWV